MLHLINHLIKVVCCRVSTLMFFTLGAFSVQASEKFSNIEQYLVHFDPSITTSDTGKSCSGILRSADTIATSSQCALSAWRLINSGVPVRVLGLESDDESFIGQLPDLSLHSFARLLHRTESAMLVPYVPVSTQADGATTDFPRFASYDHSVSFTGRGWLFQPTEPELWSSVNLEQNAGNEVFYLVATTQGQLLDAAGYKLLGLPVINERGEVICLMSRYDHCETYVDPPAINDGSCKVSYFQCTHAKWADCMSHHGVGTCMNDILNITCDVNVVPNHFSDEETGLQCLNSIGCGIFACPAGCEYTHEECSCFGSWGLCDATGKTMAKPPQCIKVQGGGGAVSFRCNQSRFFGVVVGIPLAVTTVVIIGVIAGFFYKFRHPQYERMN